MSGKAGIRQITRNGDNTISFSFTPLNGTTGIDAVPAVGQTAVRSYTLSGMVTTAETVPGGTKQVVIVKDGSGKVRKEVR